MSLDVRLDVHKKMKLLATCVVGVYWKTHIQVKYKSSVVDGPKILFEVIQEQKLLFGETEELRIMRQSLQQNCFLAHSKNLTPAFKKSNFYHA